MNKQELFEKIDGLYQEFVAQHNGTTKKSQANARKPLPKKVKQNKDKLAGGGAFPSRRRSRHAQI
jgi:hypothetical protein